MATSHTLTKTGAALALIALTSLLISGCERQEEVIHGPGVDLQNKVLYVGALNDESGPAAAFGRPFALGNRITVHQINTGQSDLLPEGWRVRLVERDHGYNPQRAIDAFEETRQRVLFYVSVFGTPNIQPLQPYLDEHGIVAFPTSSGSFLADHRYTPPTGPSNRAEAARGLDWIVEREGGAENVTISLVYQQDDYGHDGRGGLIDAAEHYGIEIASSHGYNPAATSFSEIVEGLVAADADYVFMASLPGATGAIVAGTAAQGYMPTWVSTAPAWSGTFFEPGRIPNAETIFEEFYFVTGLPIWGEDEPFVREFMSAFEEYTRGRVPPDPYILVAYIYAQVPYEAFSRALAAGDVTRGGYLRALQSIDDVDFDGALPEPLDLSRFPYITSTQTRVMRPLPGDMTDPQFEEVAGYARPSSVDLAID